MAHGVVHASKVGIFVVAVALFVPLMTAPRTATGNDEWRVYAGSNAGLKYSPLDQINRGNVKNLKIAWRQSAMPTELRRGRAGVALPTNYEVTPLKVGNLLYATAGDGSVMALNPGTGQVVWTFVPPELRPAESSNAGAPAKVLVRGRGVNRGLSYWTDGNDARLITISGRSMIALDAKTGALLTGFGTGGMVDLTKGYRRPAASYRTTNPVTIVKDVIVVGGTATGTDGRAIPGDIRGYEVRTGKQVWTFNVVPEPGEYGSDTWLNESYANAGNGGVWATMAADDELGYVYLPTESLNADAPDYWGGKRPGSGLFAESLVALDARTGKRVWHFQAVHHGIWDYDFPTGPNLVDITVNGRKVKAIAAVTKQAFVYVLDRVTGKPVWPIEERPVPSGDAPDEWYSPTQPFPTKPPAFDQQGVRIDDLIDFTPELRQEAIKILSQYRYGPLFTPDSVANMHDGKKGTVEMPGVAGGANWQGAGFDPETGTLYVTSIHSPMILELVKSTDKGAVGGQASKYEWTTRGGGAIVGPWLEGPQGLPIFKPPYGRLVAIDLNKGEILWTVANGDGPRDHPAIKQLNLPKLGNPGRASVLVTKTMVFLGEGGNDEITANPPFGGGKMFRAYDKKNGSVLWETELPGGTTGAPMTYSFNGKQYIVVATGWKDVPGELVALALP